MSTGQIQSSQVRVQVPKYGSTTFSYKFEDNFINDMKYETAAAKLSESIGLIGGKLWSFLETYAVDSSNLFAFCWLQKLS